MSTHLINEVEVNAVAVSSRQGLTPSYSLSSADFQRLNVVDLSSALRRMPGITLRDYGGAGGMKTVSVRGLGSTHTGVALDGLLLPDGQSGQVDLQQFQLQEVATLTLQSAGTADIFQPARNFSRASLLSIATSDSACSKILLGAGSWGYLTPSARLSMNVGQMNIALQGGYTRADNDYPFVVENGVDTHTERRNNSRMQQGFVNVASFLRINNESTLKTMVRLADNDRQLPGIVRLYTNSNDETLRDRSVTAQMQLLTQLASRWWLKASARWNWVQQQYHNGIPSGGIRTEHYIQREYYATASLLYRPLTGLELDYSADFWNNTLTTTLAANPNPKRNSFLQSVSAKWTKGRLTAMGQLLQSCIDDENHLSPLLSASLKLSDVFGLRLSAKEMFRMPTMTEMYYYHLGSQDLKPETTRQINLGVTFTTPCGRNEHCVFEADASLDIYINKVSEKIVAIPFNMFVWRYLNLEEVKGKGLDFLGNVTFRPGFRHTLILGLNYSLQSIENCPVNKAFSRMQIAYTPLHSGSASLAWENPWTNISTSLTFASEAWTTNEHNTGTSIPGYAELGATLYRTFMLPHVGKHSASGETTLALSMQNILDKRYCLVAHYPMPGRNWKISLIYKL